MKTILLLWILLILAQIALSEEIVFKKNGQPVKSVGVAQLMQSEALPLRPVPTFNPLEGAPLTFSAVPFNDLLTQTYGEGWKKTEEVLFTCLDGYEPSIPVQKFLKSISYLAFGIEGRPFELTLKRKNRIEKVSAGPAHLIWENSSETQSSDFETFMHWPFKITEIDLIRFADKFPHMAPPGNASPSVKKGFLYFREHCSNCHSINGEGGHKGPELNSPVNVTEYFKEPWLKKWILSPTSVRSNATMPGYAGFEKRNPGAVDQIIAYIKSMKK